ELDSPQRVVDMGCGPGNMTLTMPHRWPNATITGYDASAEMIEDARTLIANQQGSYKNVSFQQQEAGSWTPPTDTDVIVSNAMFQWLPDHINVINEWLDRKSTRLNSSHVSISYAVF